MIDTTLVALAYGVLAVAAVATLAAVAGLVIAVRELGRPRRVTVTTTPAASAAAAARHLTHAA